MTAVLISLPIAYSNAQTYEVCFNPTTTGTWSSYVNTYCVTNMTASSFITHNNNGWTNNFITVGY